MLRKAYCSRRFFRRATVLLALAILIFASTRMQADTGTCGSGQSLTLPFTDVPGSNIFFCSIAQAFFTGLTNGTTPTTYSPAANVTRDQMAAFITRTQDSALKRGSRRAAAGQWETPRDAGVLNTTIVGSRPRYSCYDGEDIWVANRISGTVTRVHASDGRVLGTWTGAVTPDSVISAAGFIYVTGSESPGLLYRINPTLSPGVMTLVEGNLGVFPGGIAFDGLNLWTADFGGSPGLGTITRYNIVTDTKTTFSAGYDRVSGIVFDGTHLWVADAGAGALHRVNPLNATILETLVIGDVTASSIPVFDGSNIWVPINDALAVVSISSPARLVATLTGNGLEGLPGAASFDGERIMVINENPSSVSLWKASSLTPISNLTLDPTAELCGVSNDGLHFWISFNSASGNDFLLRF